MTATAVAVGPERPRHRPDIEGLRAVAVLLVLLFHADVPGFDGGFVGVDVFFVLSGFLITRLLLDERERTGTVHLREFYARRLRRLLPASSLVIVTTVVAAWFLAPPLLVGPIATDGLWSAGWVANYRFITQGLDYLAAAGAESPLLHFWSLAVEEQFYLVWPALVLLVARGSAARLRRRVAILLGVVVVGSLAASVIQTATEPVIAYYSLHTRAWELAIGGLLAIGAPLTGRVSPAVGRWLGVGGLAGLVVAATTYTTATPFPGWTALLPVLATVALLVAGQVGGREGVGRLLYLQPLQHIGRWSYSLYLWHWPVLVLAEYAVPGSLTVPQKVGLLAASTVLSAATYHLLEDPVRRSAWLARRPRRSIGVGVGLVAGTVAASLVAITAVPNLAGTGEVTDAGEIGAVADPSRHEEVLRSSVAADLLPASLQPPLHQAREVQPELYEDGCFLGFPDTSSPECVYGSAAETARTIVLFGDSHAAHWFPPLLDLTVGREWRLVAFTKAGCPSMEIPVFRSGIAYEACDEWREDSIDRIIDLAPDLVVLANSRAYDPVDEAGRELPGGREPFQAAGQTAMIERLRSALPERTDIALVGTTPQPPTDTPVCLSEHLERISNCAGERQQALAVNLLEHQRQVAEQTGVIFVDPAGWLCVDGVCPAVIADFLVYNDGSHLSPPLTRWLRPLLEHELLRDSSLPAP